MNVIICFVTWIFKTMVSFSTVLFFFFLLTNLNNFIWSTTFFFFFSYLNSLSHKMSVTQIFLRFWGFPSPLSSLSFYLCYLFPRTFSFLLWEFVWKIWCHFDCITVISILLDSFKKIVFLLRPHPKTINQTIKQQSQSK